MIPIKPALNYFRDCYRLDTRTTQLDNFFGRKVEHRYVFDGKERLLNRSMPYLPIPDDLGQKLEGILSLYSKEKVLYYCSFFMVGYGLSVNGKRVRICAPLFLHETKLNKNEDGYSVKVEANKRMINIDPIASLRKSTDIDARYSISKEVPAETFDFGSMSKLQRILTSCYDGLSADELLLYPSLTNEATIKRLYNGKAVKEGSFKVVPAAGLGIMKRSSNTQGIMTELAEMADQKTELPDSIKALFGHKPGGRAFSLKNGYVPAMLNDAQQGVLKNAKNHPLSMVIGPPGTGKSFTIAALAIEFMSREKSVLIVSKTDQAVDVIDGKIEKDLGIKGASIRAGKSGYLKKLKARMTEILGGFGSEGSWDSFFQQKQEASELREKIRSSEQRLKKSRKKYESLLSHEMRWGDDLSRLGEASFFDSMKLKYIQWLTGLKTPHWSVVEDFMSSALNSTSLIREFIELSFKLQVSTSLLEDRQTLSKLLSAIRARTSSKREKLFSELNFKTMFHAFPIWLCKMSDLHKVLPFEKYLFDVVIIDEATQCDIASCLPAIYRAKQTVIVGDPKQLRHVSFLSGTAQESLQKKYGLEDSNGSLDYRNQSVLDFVDLALQSQEQVSFLNEHYRSLPDLIRFSNERFYDKGLKIMSVIPEDHSKNNIHHITVTGTRDNKGLNIQEIEQVLTDLNLLIENEKNIDAHLCRSFGILSPFRDQVDAFNQAILKRFSLDIIEKHDLLCGTAHSFQGEERDVMFLSLCLDNTSHSAGFSHINRADVFNVSVTRAKSEMRVYTSFELTELKPDALIRGYLEQAALIQEKDTMIHKVHDDFLNQVKTALDNHQFTVRIGYEIADLSLDLVIILEKEMVGIDLIGYPGVFEEGLSLSAYKVLHRVGIRTFPLPYSFWKFDQKQCLTALLNFVAQ